MGERALADKVLVTIEDNKIKYCASGLRFNTLIDYISEADLPGIKIPTSIDDIDLSMLKDRILEITSNRNHTHRLELNFDNVCNKNYYTKGLEKLREYNPALHLISNKF